MLFSTSLMVLHFTFGAMTHFEFIFRKVLGLCHIFSMYMSHFSSSIFKKIILFSIKFILFFVKDLLAMFVWVYFCALSFLLHWFLFCQYHSFNYCSFMVSLEVRYYHSTDFFFFNIVLVIPDLFLFDILKTGESVCQHVQNNLMGFLSEISLHL